MQPLIDNTKKMQQWNDDMKRQRDKKARAMATRLVRAKLRMTVRAALRRLFTPAVPDAQTRAIWQHRK